MISHFRRLFLWLLLLFTFIIPANLILAQDDQSPLSIEIEYTDGSGNPASPVSVAGEDITNVQISVDANEDVCPDVVSTRPIDAVLVIDVSGSMNEPTNEGITKLAATQQAAVNFIAQLRAGDQAAVVSFSTGARVEVPLTVNAADTQAAIQGLSAGGGTNIASGIDEATNLLAGAGHNSEQDAIPVIIVLSDGESNRNAVINSSERARRLLDNVRIATIGLGTGVDTTTLEAISDEGLAFFTASSAELITFYERIITLIQPRINATNITLTFTYDRANYELQPGTLNPPGEVTGNQLIWRIGELNAEDDPRGFSFDVRSTSTGAFPVGDLSVSYNPCEEVNERTDIIPVPVLTTQLPTPTPPPTATLLPTATPTPLPTATPLPPASSNQGPTGAVVADGVGSAYCDTETYNLIGTIVALLVLVLVLLFILWRATKLYTNDRQPGIGGLACFLMRWAPLVYLAILLFFIIPPVAAQTCELPESVYHWRIDSESSGLYMTYQEFEGDVPQVEAVNEFGCIGCHVTNTERELVAAITGPPPGRILVVNNEGENVAPALASSARAVYLTFSPDGSQIAYSDDLGDIYIMDLDTGISTAVPGASDSTVAETMPAWTVTPDNRELLAFVRTDNSNLDRSGLTVSNSSAIYVVDLTAGDGIARPIFGADASEGGLHYYPVFSPDGRWLSFTWALSGRSYSNNAADIFIIPAIGGQRIRINANIDDASDAWATWSADGSQIAFQSDRNDPAYDLFVASVADDGTTGEAVALSGASIPGETELLAYWGTPIGRISLADELAWLVPIPVAMMAFLILAAVFSCVIASFGRVAVAEEEEEERPPVVAPTIAQPVMLTREQRIKVLWEPQPTLIIGLGRSGRWVLTHLKKTLQDAGLGKIPDDIVLLCIAAGDVAKLSDPERADGFVFAGVGLSEDEIIEYRDTLRPMIQNARNDAALKGWVRSDYLESLGPGTQDPQNGFGGRRALGRLALINNLRGNSEETNVDIWESLKAAIQKVMSSGERRVNLMLVSDLSDDIGSGSFLDIAYLLRRAAAEAGSSNPRLVAHFVTDRAQPDKAQQHAFEVNTAAALRELSRFELSTSILSPMVYREHEDTPHPLDGTVNYRLFDEIYLYDGGGRQSILANTEAAASGLFPMMADSIALWMDAAARRKQLAAARAANIANAQQFTVRNEQLMVSGLGIYQYRLPFYDILNVITARYARDVLQRLLIGESTATPELRADLVKDPDFAGKSALAVATEFLNEVHGSAPDLDSKWRNLLRYMLTDHKNLSDAAQNLNKRAAANGMDALKHWLDEFLTLLLNGVSPPDQTPDYQALRGGKLGLAISVLYELGNTNEPPGLIWQGINRVRAVVKEDHPALTTLTEWAQYVNAIYEALREVAVWLGMPPHDGSLWHVLGVWSGQLDRAQQEMKRLVTRRYIWQDQDGKDLATVWYDRYMQDHVLEGLSALGWEMRDGELRLNLQMPRAMNDEDAAPLVPHVIDSKASDEDNAAATVGFAREMLNLARFFAAPIPDREDLRTILANSVLNEANLSATATDLRNFSEVALNFTQNQSSIPGIILSANPNVKTEQIESKLQQYLHSGTLLKLNTTDPYTLTVVQTVDAVPLNNVPSITEANAEYNKETGINEGRRPQGAGLTSVFDIEERALSYERELRKLHQQARVLDQSLVARLAEPNKLESFLLAMASNEDGVMGRDIRINAEEWQAVLVTSDEMRSLTAPIINALQRYYDRIPAAAAAAMRMRYEEDAEFLDEWQEWQNGGYERWYPHRSSSQQPTIEQLIINDMIAMTRILMMRIL